MSRSFGAGFGFPSAGGFSALDFSNTPFRLLSNRQRIKAKAVYGDSLDFSRIFVSNKTGLGGRPFTCAFPEENQIVQIMNCGDFTPKDPLLIHVKGVAMNAVDADNVSALKRTLISDRRVKGVVF